jgi:hypothetical protein
VIKELETKLETRAPKLNAELELADCRYSRALLTDSSVSECLETFVYEKKAGLAVFGRHRGWHHNPLSIGQMPFHAMLALPCPIVVFPGSSD